MAKTFNDIPAPIQGAILVVVAVALAGGMFWYFVLPLNDKRDGLDKEVSQAQGGKRQERSLPAAADGVSEPHQATGKPVGNAPFDCSR